MIRDYIGNGIGRREEPRTGSSGSESQPETLWLMSRGVVVYPGAPIEIGRAHV